MKLVDLTKDLSNFKYTDYDKVDGQVDFIPNVDKTSSLRILIIKIIVNLLE